MPALHSQAVPSDEVRSRRLAAVGVVVAALVAIVGGIAAFALPSGSSGGPVGVASAAVTTSASAPPRAASAPALPPGATPGAGDGVIPADAPAALDSSLPAITRLDPALLAALRAANADARKEGVDIRIASGWRSIPYQRWLFDQAVKTYGSPEAAARYVASPEASAHVTGKAVDVAPIDAQLWLQAHGSAYGLCQTYANERWHFERSTTPGGVCPAMRRDASE